MIVVKICGLTHLDDALAAVDAGADLLGFVLVASSPRSVSLRCVDRIVGALRARGLDTPCVGVVAGMAPAQALRAREWAGFDLMQVHDPEPGSLAAALYPHVIVARQVTGPESLAGLERVPAYAYLLDARGPERRAEAGIPWDWRLLGQARLPRRTFLAGGLHPGNVAQAVREANPYGVDVASGVEAAPGRKDRAAVQRFVRAVREVDGGNETRV